MEAMLADNLVLESGAFLGALAALVLVIGGILLGRLADQEGTGKRFFWAEWALAEWAPPEEEEPRVLAERDAECAA